MKIRKYNVAMSTSVSVMTWAWKDFSALVLYSVTR